MYNSTLACHSASYEGRCVMGMRVIRDGLQFCNDCTCWAVNGDDSGIDAHYDSTQQDACDRQRTLVHEGVAKFGPHLVCVDPLPWTDEYRCDSCMQFRQGEACGFAVLGPLEWSASFNGINHDEGEGPVAFARVSAATCTRQDTLTARIAALLNTESELETLLDLVSDLLDSHDASDVENEHTIEAKCAHQLRVVQSRLKGDT